MSDIDGGGGEGQCPQQVAAQVNHGGGGEGQGSNQVVIAPTIPASKPVVGSIRKLPSRTQVYLGKAGYVDICNYVFQIIGM